MRINRDDQIERRPIIKKVLSKIFLVFILVGGIAIEAIYIIKASDYVTCHTVAICDSRPTPGPEMVATQVAGQYEYALLDMKAGRYKNAKERLEYVIARNPEYPGAAEKLLEVESILGVTPPP